MSVNNMIVLAFVGCIAAFILLEYIIHKLMK